MTLAISLGCLFLSGCQSQNHVKDHALPHDQATEQNQTRQTHNNVDDSAAGDGGGAATSTTAINAAHKKPEGAVGTAFSATGGDNSSGSETASRPSDNADTSSPSSDASPQIILVNEATARRFDLKTEEIIERDLTLPLHLTGHVEADTGGDVDVSARIAGRLKEIVVKPGEKVKKGQLLAMIDSREVAELEGEMLEAKSKLDIAQAHAERERQVYEEQIARPKALLDARAKVAHAKVKLDLAQGEFHRVEDLYKEKIAAGKDFIAAKAVLTEAKLEMDQDQTALLREEHLYDNRVLMKKDYQLAMAEVTREKQHLSTIIKRLEFIGADRKLTSQVLKSGDMNGLARIDAPMDGIVNHYQFVAGEMVHPDNSILKLTNLQTVQVLADLPEVDLQRVKIGDRVKIKVSSYPDTIFNGTISLIYQHVHLETHSLPIQARLANLDGRLKPNMSAEIDLDSTIGRCLACPKAAVHEHQGHKIVYVQKPGGFEERPVKLGEATAHYEEVLEGLKAGEIVATHGSRMLRALRR
jgi:cobalt-zinc-cadmium efflux system membrane fusion protein